MHNGTASISSLIVRRRGNTSSLFRKKHCDRTTFMVVYCMRKKKATTTHPNPDQIPAFFLPSFLSFALFSLTETKMWLSLKKVDKKVVRMLQCFLQDRFFFFLFFLKLGYCRLVTRGRLGMQRTRHRPETTTAHRCIMGAESDNETGNQKCAGASSFHVNAARSGEETCKTGTVSTPRCILV